MVAKSKKGLEKKLQEIADCIFSKVKENNFTDSLYGIHGDQSGILLFLYYYYRYTNDSKFKTIADLFAERVLNKTTNVKLHTFSGGLSGILYLFLLIRQEGFIHIDLNKFEDPLEKYLVKSMKNDFRSKNYDFMHGALGVELYFLKKGNIEIIKDVIDFLYNNAEKDYDRKVFKWKSVLSSKTNEVGYNIALSHGMAGIVLFLCRVIRTGYVDSKVLEMLNGSLNYLMSQEINDSLYGCLFPSQSIENSQPITGSRLAWCYGDIGIGYSIWYSGKTINDKNLEKKGLSILLNSSKRRSFSETHVFDAGICHGSAGLAMVFRRMYLETNNNDFMLTTKYWVEHSLSQAKYGNGLAGYKTFFIDNWIDDYSLITGISGIGLMYMSFLKNDKQQWDEIFLL